jgi:hypothetical protein
VIVAAVGMAVAVVIGIVTLAVTNQHQPPGLQVMLPLSGLKGPEGLAVDSTGAVYVARRGE